MNEHTDTHTHVSSYTPHKTTEQENIHTSTHAKIYHVAQLSSAVLYIHMCSMGGISAVYPHRPMILVIYVIFRTSHIYLLVLVIISIN